MIELIDKIYQSKIQTSPFPHIFIENFLSQVDIDHMVEQFNKNLNDFEYECESFWLTPTFITSKIDNIISKFKNKNFLDVLYHKFKAKQRFDYTDDAFLYVWKYDNKDCQTQNFWHTDQGAIFTLQIFFPDKNYIDGGTVLNNVSYDTENQIELPLQYNSVSIFPCIKNSFHKVIQRGYERKSLLMRFQNPKSPRINGADDDQTTPFLELDNTL